MSTRSPSRNNIIAGVFVVLGVVLAVAISIILSGAQERLTPTRGYDVRFATRDGTAGLEPGSVVTLGGQKIGRVTGIRVARETPDAVDVRIAIRADLRVYEDAVAYLVQPILGGLASVNLPTLGSSASVAAPLGAGPEVEPGEVIPGRIAPPSLLASAGYGEAQATQVQGLIRDAAAAVEKVNRIADRIDRDVDPTLAMIRETLEDARQVAADIRARTPEWAREVDALLASAKSAAADFDALGDDARARADAVQAIIDRVQHLIDRNADGVEKIIADVSRVTGRLDAESVGMLNAALAAAESGATRFSDAAARADRFLTEETPSLRKILANFRLASDQVKLAMVEIRTKPWLLLYSPKTKELESEVLQSAARTYAEAVSDLRAASEALEAAVAADGSPLATDRESIESMTGRISDAFKTYQQAEQRMLDLLIGKRP